MAQDPRNPKTPKKIKTDFKKPTKFQADMAKKLEKRSKKTLNQTLKTGLKTPSKSSISKILRKMGPRGKAAAAILAEFILFLLLICLLTVPYHQQHNMLEIILQPGREGFMLAL